MSSNYVGSAQAVAIVGIGCRLPAATNDPSRLWNLLCRGANVVGALPVSRFRAADAALYGAFLDDIAALDAKFFGLSPREAAAMDPQQRMLLEVSCEALEDAGLTERRLNGTLGSVFIGLHASDYDALQMANSAEPDIHMVVGGARNAAAARISHALGLQGPSLVIDTDRSSSLVALHMACASLRRGETKVAIVGGANLILNLKPTLAFARAGMLAKDGQCKFGDARADGFVRSEGVGVVVLKPLQTAVADGDAIYAVIRGSAVNHMGASSSDLMTPSQSAQEDLLRAAYQDAQIDPASVGYVEAHGTGTPVGDPIELGALGAVLGTGRGSQQVCHVGSVKTNLGHTEAAGGIIGLIKAALILKHKQIPASLHMTAPNPRIPFDALHMAVPSALMPWPAAMHPARAAVSAFGLTGANAHVVLEEAPARQPAVMGARPGPHMVLLSAKDPAALRASAQAYAAWAGDAKVDLADAAAATAVQRNHYTHRMAVLAQSHGELQQNLRAYLAGETKPEICVGPQDRAAPPKIAFVYSGQGSQWAGMARELLPREAVFRRSLEEIDAAMRKFAPWSLMDMVASTDPAAWTVDVIQPMLFAMSVALTELWRSFGVKPDAVVGTSMGEVAACYVAGALTLDDAVRIICKRSALARTKSGEGGMMVVNLSRAQAEELIAKVQDRVSVAVSGSPNSTVLSGQVEALQALATQLESRKVFARFVRVDFASHSPFVDALRAPLLAELQGVRPMQGSVPIYSTVTGGALDGSQLDAAYWVRNLRQPVLLGDTLQGMLGAGFNTFLEVSPHPLQWDAILDNCQHVGKTATIVASLRRDESAMRNLLISSAALHCAGQTVDWQAISGLPAAHVELPYYAWQRQNYWFTPAPSNTTDVNQAMSALPPAPMPTAQAPGASMPIAPPPMSPTPPSAAGSPTTLASRLAKADAVGRQELLRAFIRDQVSRILGVSDSTAIDSSRALRDLGFKSVMESELRTVLSSALGHGLPAGLTFSYPSVDRLAAHLSGAEFPGKSKQRAAQAQLSEPVAIIGMACRFPGGADSPEAFWKLLRDGVDAVREIPEDRWDAAAFYSATPTPGKMTTRWGGFVDGVRQFDAGFFNISPREAERMDPQQRLLLEVSWEALERAGQSVDRLAGSRTGVFVGAMNYNEYANLKERAGAGLESHDSTGNANSVAAGRLAYLYGFQGPCMVVDTACSSSLVSLHLATQSLRIGECRMAVVGGVNLILSPDSNVMFSRSGMMSPDGRCRSFDAGANGYVRGEGCGVIVVKRLKDAITDGDPVLAVIRGTAVNQDGRSNGLTAPNGNAQEAVIRDALVNAEVEGKYISYVEAHGTGTPLGDPVELQALSAVLGAQRAHGPLIVGSVKTNLGHLEAAAGMAGLMKVVLSMANRAIPAHLHYKKLNPQISLDGRQVRIAGDALQEWNAPQGQTLLAGVSSFGFSGTNAHVILEEAPATAASEAVAPGPQLLVLSARSKEALQASAQQHRDFLREQSAQPSQLADLAYTSTARRAHHGYRLAVTGANTEAWCQALDAFLKNKPHAQTVVGSAPRDTPPKVAFVFPGQGSQWQGMGAELLQNEPVFAAAMQACDAAIQKHAGFSVIEELRSTSSRLDQIDVVQPALFAMQVSLAALWRAWGVEPVAVVGHSMGEVAASYVAGALSLDDAARVICLRSQLMKRVAGQGAMVMLEMTPEQATKAAQDYPGKLFVAVHNGPRATVLSGDVDAIQQLTSKLKADNQFCGVVKTDVAFHSPHMDGLCADLQTGLAPLQPSTQKLPIYSSVSGELMQPGAHGAGYWVRNLRDPVEFAKATGTMLETGFDAFIEISPHPVLTAALEPMLRADKAAAPRRMAVGTLRRDEPERQNFLTALGKVYGHGVAVEFEKRYATPRQVGNLPTYAWQRQSYWVQAAKGDSKGAAASAVRRGSHPLLGAKLAAATGAFFWETQINLQELPYLADHRVGDAVVLPGAAFVEIMLAASRDALGPDVSILDDVFFRELLVLRQDAPTVVQVVLEASGPNDRRVSINSHASDGWTLHAEGVVRPKKADKVVPAKAYAVTGPTGRVLPKAALYKQFAAIEMRYGPQFQGVEEAWVVNNEAWGRLAPPLPGYTLHPAFFDSILQMTVLQAWKGQGEPAVGAPSVPVALGALRLYGRAEDILYSRAEFAPQPNSIGTWCGDLQLLDKAGNLVGEVRGLALQMLGSNTDRSKAAAGLDAELFVRPSWKKLEGLSTNRPAASADESWLILGNDSLGMSGALQKLLANRGAQVEHILSPVGLEKNLQEAFAGGRKYRGIVHLWSLNIPAAGDNADAFKQAQELGCDSAAQLVQSIVKQGWRDAPRVWLVTAGAQHMAGDPQEVAVLQTPLWGMGRSLAYEHPELRCTRVDLRPGAGALAVEQMADALIGELVADEREDELVLRPGNVRFGGRLTKGVPPGVSASADMPLRKDSAYLITGGLGGLGLYLAKWLAERGAGHLILMGRRAPSTPDQESALSQIKAAGAQVHLALADVAEREPLRAALSDMASKAPPIRGIIHAAGLLDYGPIAELDPKKLAAVMAPKVQGAWNLHTLSKDMPLDFCIYYGSASALLGSPRMSSYAAANAFLDGLATARRLSGLPALSVNWGPFSEVGMVAGQTKDGERIAQRGLRNLSPQEGTDVLARIWHSEVPQQGIVSMKARQWLEFYPRLAASKLFSELLQEGMEAAPQGEAAAGNSTAFLTQLKQAPANKRLEMMIAFLHDVLITVLRLEPTMRIEHDRAFKSLGIDSLMGLELRNHLEATLGVTLSATTTWVHPNLGALSPYLLKELGVADAPAVVATGTLPPEANKDREEIAALSQDDLLATLKAELE